MKTLVLAIFYLMIANFLFSQQLIYPNLPSDEITGIHFLNENEILFINSGGSIFKSYNSGLTWSLKKHFQGESFISIEFIDDKNGFVIPEKPPNFATIGVIVTNDAGETWNLQSLTVSSIHDFLPLSESVSLKSTWDGKIQRLDNFYNNWETVYELPTYSRYDPEFGEIIYSYGNIASFEKITNNKIFALGLNVNAFYDDIIKDSLSFLLKSEDAGISWDTLWIGLNSFIQQITFANNLTGWIRDGKNIYRTLDGGKNWEILQTGYSIRTISDLASINENILYTTIIDNQNNNLLLKSIDAGENWSGYNLYMPNAANINFYNEYMGILFGKGLIKTNNSGKDWEVLYNPIRDDIILTDFINNNVGIASSGSAIYKTEDGGNSWRMIFRINEGVIGGSSDKNKIEFLDNGKGWLVSSGNLFETADFGESWTELKLSNKSYDFINSSVEFYDNNLGLILNVAEETEVGSRIYENKYNYFTEDGGGNWERIEIVDEFKKNTFSKIKFTDSKHLFAIGWNGFWLSRDTAKTWQSIYDVDYFSGSYTFDFADSLFGVLIISYRYSYVTIDGGKSWNSFTKPIGNHPQECVILGLNYSNEQRVLECGSDGKLIQYNFSSNGEVTFSRQIITNTKQSLNTIEVFVEEEFPSVWIGGNGFTFLFRKFEKIFTDLNSETMTIPSVFSLSQNYPNPFNPITKIKYSVPESDFVTLKIYDLLGKEIVTLVNKEIVSGLHECIFNASNLSSGAYFYKLQAGIFTQTKKLLLIK